MEVEPVAFVASSERLARAAAGAAVGHLSGARIRPFSLRRYLVTPNAPRRIVLCLAGSSVDEQVGFLRRASDRLLWPEPRADFRDAIAGLRTADARPRAVRPPRSRLRGSRIEAALLLEGLVDAPRARTALSSDGPRDWIVESARHVRIEAALLVELARCGVRWSALEPVELIALYAAPALARMRGRWKRLVPAGIPVWTKTPDSQPPRSSPR